MQELYETSMTSLNASQLYKETGLDSGCVFYSGLAVGLLWILAFLGASLYHGVGWVISWFLNR
jgi:hypothetical protein